MALKMVDTNTGEICEQRDDIDDQNDIDDGRTFSHIGTCKFCGQTALVDTPHENEDQRKVDEFVTMRCTCEQASQYQQRVARVITAKANLREVAAGVDPDIVAIAEKGIKMIGDRMIAGITIKFGRRVLKAQGKSTGSIVVELTETTKDTREA